MSDPIGYNGSFIDMTPFIPECPVCQVKGCITLHPSCQECGIYVCNLASHVMEWHLKRPKLDYQPRMAELAKANMVDKQARDLDYQTPEYILKPIRDYFGGQIPLDPATCGSNPTKAARFYTPTENGLERPWDAPWFVNPPYGSEMKAWIEKIGAEADRYAEEPAPVGHGLALLPVNRTETEYWQKHIWEKANAVCFVRKRIAFIRPSTGEKATGNPYASAIWGFGVGRSRFKDSLKDVGKVRFLD